MGLDAGESLCQPSGEEKGVIVRCPIGHENPEHYRFCGECGVPLVLPSSGPADGRMAEVSQPPADAPTILFNPTLHRSQYRRWQGLEPQPAGATWPRDLQPGAPRKRAPQWLWITAVSIAVVAVMATVTVWEINRIGNRATDNERRSAFPHAPVNPWPAPQPPPTAYIPAPGTVPPSAVIQPALPDADTQGFRGYPGARCNYTNPAVAIGRTSLSLVVDLPDRRRAALLQGIRLTERLVGRDRRSRTNGNNIRRDE